ncbi:SIS domain-containing protein [Acholeplasma vituli]|uniref:SIS domain-containing protein n=1 Tax=Paracholeplasma vituli TaxID=69473 RepID=A0ABT2PT34_9MOLU|nr:SIS domain-containing protein [Paracholeplasma vituli]MCU0104109.1 SIS domain-containing protein [Paracholeplasma vituli]
MNHIVSFNTVMQKESNAILKAIEAIKQDQLEFIVDSLIRLEGKLIVIGLGKAGHIGKKLAASFSSMGTSSFFVHATELFHGDFGMITNQDMAILISHSGETEEVIKAAATLKDRGIKTIALTRSQTSSLSKLTSYQLNYDIQEEADHLNLAPTNSSTVMLAIGDALMSTVSEAKGYTKEDFKKNHPGGSLGQRLTK